MNMQTWYIKSLGTGSAIYAALHDLNMLSAKLCPSIAHPYVLVIDTVTVETLAFFAPEEAELGLAFGADACSKPMIDGVRFVDLGYAPLPNTELNESIFDTMHRRASPGNAEATA